MVRKTHKRGIVRENYVQLHQMDDDGSEGDDELDSDAEVEEITIGVQRTDSTPLNRVESETAKIVEQTTLMMTSASQPTTESNAMTNEFGATIHTETESTPTTELAISATAINANNGYYYYGESSLPNANLIYITTTDDPKLSAASSNEFRPNVQYDLPNYYRYDSDLEFRPIFKHF